MSFPKKIKEDALVSSGRHCCICHKFCGRNIEIHHIKSKVAGGDDSSDNCIPLCFDCHSDVKSYNKNHPKGNSYSSNELKRHRDDWYEKAKNNLGLGPSDHLDQDKSIIETIIKILPPNGTIQFLRNHNFESRFLIQWLKDTDDFINYFSINPWQEFFDSDLESQRSVLFNYINRFNKIIGLQTFPVHITLEDSICNEVPPEWKEEQPQRYDRVINSIHELSDKIIDSYDNLIKLGRKKLGLDIKYENKLIGVTIAEASKR
jgi:hypothetical protein